MNSFPCMHLTFWLARCVGVHRFPASLIPILQFELRSKLVRIGIDAFLEMLQWLLHPSIVVQAPRRQCGVARDETRIRKICHITRYQINDFYWRMKTKRDLKKSGTVENKTRRWKTKRKSRTKKPFTKTKRRVQWKRNRVKLIPGRTTNYQDNRDHRWQERKRTENWVVWLTSFGDIGGR